MIHDFLLFEKNIYFTCDGSKLNSNLNTMDKDLVTKTFFLSQDVKYVKSDILSNKKGQAYMLSSGNYEAISFEHNWYFILYNGVCSCIPIDTDRCSACKNDPYYCTACFENYNLTEGLCV